MKIINVEIINTYSCDNCNDSFKTRLDLIKDPVNSFYVFCSNLCHFRFIYFLVNKQDYSDENLKLILKIIGKDKIIKDFNRNIAIYTISKFYYKKGLSYITKTLTLDIDKNILTKWDDYLTLDMDKNPYGNRDLSMFMSKSIFVIIIGIVICQFGGLVKI